MNQDPVSTNESSGRTLTISRVLDAPRSQVWTAWTDPEQVAQWWGPEGFTTKVSELDLTPGGRSRYIMIGPDGTEYPVKGVFREIIPGERIVTTDEFDEGFEKVVEADLPQGIVLTVIFADAGEKTRLTLNLEHPTPEDRRKHEKMGVIPGWNSSLDCLVQHLKDL